MANQYHDELGRFCSRSEMGQAVDRLAATMTSTAFSEEQRNQAAQQWFTLKNEYEEILSKPESTEEKLQNFLTGEPDRDETYPATRAGMLKLLVSDDYKGEVKQEDITRLIDEIVEGDAGGFAVNYYTSVFESSRVSFSDKLRIARKYDNGLAVLVKTSTAPFFSNPALESELVQGLEKNEGGLDYYTRQLAWDALALSPNAATRAALIKQAANERWQGTELPAVLLGRNGTLTQEEALQLLENVAAHQPDDFEKLKKNLAAGAEKRRETGAILDLDGALGSLSAGASSAERHQRWRRNAFSLEDDRDVVAYLKAKAKLEMKKSQWERPTENLVLSFSEGRELRARQARLDANELPALQKSLKQADKERKNRRVPHFERERNAIPRYFDLRDRVDAAQRYRTNNERVALLREELEQARRNREAAALDAAVREVEPAKA